MVIVSNVELRSFAERVLAACGVPERAAADVAETLVWTNLRGLDSHGVQLLPHYIAQIERGESNPAAAGHVVSESGACMTYDSEYGLGHVTARVCCDHAVRLARTYGLGMVAARECNHFGAAGFWSHRISRDGFIGIAMCDASMQVPPWQGRETRLGTNPISVAVPHPDGEGWLLDMATTTVAYAKLEQARLKGDTNVPHGWALDKDGVPTTETDSFFDGGLLMPLGGYKGSGLAEMVEVLTGVLAGGAFFGTLVTGMRDRGRPTHTNQSFIAIDVSRFLPLDEFYERMEWWLAQVRSAAPAKGYSEVLVAGDPEWRAAAERRNCGIPVHDGIWRTLATLAERLKVELPQHATR